MSRLRPATGSHVKLLPMVKGGADATLSYWTGLAKGRLWSSHIELLVRASQRSTAAKPRRATGQG